MTCKTTRRADQDIIDIYLWGYREFGRQQVERHHDGLARTLDLMADNPDGL
jgi:plasmid stabilization system protein ParE